MVLPFTSTCQDACTFVSPVSKRPTRSNANDIHCSVYTEATLAHPARATRRTNPLLHGQPCARKPLATETRGYGFRTANRNSTARTRCARPKRQHSNLNVEAGTSAARRLSRSQHSRDQRNPNATHPPHKRHNQPTVTRARATRQQPRPPLMLPSTRTAGRSASHKRHTIQPSIPGHAPPTDIIRQQRGAGKPQRPRTR